MKFIDDSTLEAVAELICGSGGDSGNGYESPEQYRTMSEIRRLFQRAELVPQGQSSTRKWFVLESLQSINGANSLERLLLRLASPKENRGDANVTQKMLSRLNDILHVEGLEVELLGVAPVLRERNPSVTVPKSRESPVAVLPDFHRLVQDDSLARILSFRWQEAQRCVQAGAYLAAVVMMGSILEGILLHRFENDLEVANRASSSPKNQRIGKPKPINEWSLSDLIDVAHEVGWLEGDVKRFSHALRESRNLVHPYVQRLHGDLPDEDTCSICWQVVQAAIRDLSKAGVRP